jgi:DNA mismatch repair protein MutS
LTRREAGFLLPVSGRRPLASRTGGFAMDARVTNGAGIARSRQALDGHEVARAHEAPAFTSILFETPADRIGDAAAPAYFADLNCDQIVDAITTDKAFYDLKPFFFASLRRASAVRYRQGVMRDLEAKPLYSSVTRFARHMQDVRDRLEQAAKSFNPEQQQALHLDAILLYGEAIQEFAAALASFDLTSQGLLAWRRALDAYASSLAFQRLMSDAAALRADLAAVTYAVQINGNRFTVSPYRGEPDYSAEVEACFAKFKQGAPRDYLSKYAVSDDMNHIEAKILEFVAKLHPDIFARLEAFVERNAEFLAPDIVAFDREVQFYVAYLDYKAELRQADLPFCYPTISETDKEIFATESFDLALAKKLKGEGRPVVGNDFELHNLERVIVVSGPNQGGKTTFARMFGQLHHLASIGCPVPGRAAKLFLFDRLFSHFEKEEKVENLRGKLEDDLVRAHTILGEATSRSILVLNEIFTSTTIQDEIFLSEKVLKRILAVDLLCVWVTFADELASFGPQTVSMVSTVVADNPALRTFKVVRRPADGLAYAMAIAKKYHLTYDAIKERIKP